MCAFVVLDLVSSVLCQEIGSEERLRSDLFCDEWNAKSSLNQCSWSISPVYTMQPVVNPVVKPV